MIRTEFGIIVLWILLSGCGGSATKELFYNKYYVCERKDDYKLAIIPSPDSNGTIFDDHLRQEFDQVSLRLTIEPPELFAKELSDNIDFNVLLNKAFSLRYSDTASTYVPNLCEVITDDELILLRRFLRDPDFALFPRSLLAEKSREYYYIATFGRLFDMHNGQLIYDKMLLLPVPESDVKGEDDIYYFMAVSLRDFFQYAFWLHFIEIDSSSIIKQ